MMREGRVHWIQTGMGLAVAGVAALAGLAGSAAGAAAQVLGQPLDGATLSARATLVDASGATMGQVVLREAASGDGVLLDIRVRGLSEGSHGVHIHETGRCVPPDFESAGGHYDPAGRGHGALHEAGMHGGDLLNLHVPADGALRAERLAPHVTLWPGAPNTLFDDDGSAIIVHAGADDYRSQPSGDAGGRVLCGVIRH